MHCSNNWEHLILFVLDQVGLTFTLTEHILGTIPSDISYVQLFYKDRCTVSKPWAQTHTHPQWVSEVWLLRAAGLRHSVLGWEELIKDRQHDHRPTLKMCEVSEKDTARTHLWQFHIITFRIIIDVIHIYRDICCSKYNIAKKIEEWKRQKVLLQTKMTVIQQALDSRRVFHLLL